MTNIGTFLKRAEYQMIATSPDARKDSGEGAATKLVIVWMIHFAGSRMDTVKPDVRKDSGEEAATKLVIVWMIHLAGSRMDTVKVDVRLGSGEEVCDEQCHCRDGAPCNQTNGTCPSRKSEHEILFPFLFKNNWTIFFSMHCDQKCILK